MKSITFYFCLRWQSLGFKHITNCFHKKKRFDEQKNIYSKEWNQSLFTRIFLFTCSFILVNCCNFYKIKLSCCTSHNHTLYEIIRLSKMVLPEFYFDLYSLSPASVQLFINHTFVLLTNLFQFYLNWLTAIVYPSSIYFWGVINQSSKIRKHKLQPKD